MLNSNELMAAIARGAAPEADAESKRSAAQACRWLLTALESEPGAPLVPPDPPVASAPAPAPAATAPKTGIPAGQILDVLIAKLKAELPDEAPAPERPAFRIPFVPVPTGSRR